MLSPTDSLPSAEISKRETTKRHKILQKLKPQLDTFDEVLLVGSMAYGYDYAVHPESDLDLLIFLDPKNAQKMKDFAVSSLACELYQKGVVAHISGVQEIEGVKCEYHFWDPQVHEELLDLKRQSAPRFSSSGKSLSGIHLNFSGQNSHRVMNFSKIEGAYIQEYFGHDIVDDRFVPYEPFVNLLLPSKNFVGDSQQRVETAWAVCRERCTKERSLYDKQASILKSLAPIQKVRPELLEELRKREV